MLITHKPLGFFQIKFCHFYACRGTDFFKFLKKILAKSLVEFIWNEPYVFSTYVLMYIFNVFYFSPLHSNYIFLDILSVATTGSADTLTRIRANSIACLFSQLNKCSKKQLFLKVILC